MKLSLFDGHCDTAYELYRRGVHLADNNCCHISLEKAAFYGQYAQFYAIWSDRHLDDEACWEQFLKIAANFHAEIHSSSDRVAQVTSPVELKDAVANGNHAAILAVEDARLTAGKLERLDHMKALGVKYLTLLWGGDTCVGGSHDTENGLTAYGKDLAKRCFELGIIPDVSHASEASVDDLISIAHECRKPFIASHSNAYGLFGHTRNLRDRHFTAIKELGGIVGVSLCPSHLTDDSLRPATAEDVFSHVDYYLSLGGENIIGFGADWDGTDLPADLSGVHDLTKVAEIMAKHNYTEDLIYKIYWKNFYDFAMRNL
ncbi:MAG: membrane dipeptidase [Clostridia bacterium]|nr:membrane dipeptidase [Clostridia bacterium]